MNFKCSCGATYCSQCEPRCPACGSDEFRSVLTSQQQEHIRQAVRSDPEFMAGVRAGVEAHRRGETGTPWSEVKKELGIK